MQLSAILYLVGFARTLLVIILIVVVIRLVARYVLPYFVQKGVKNMQQKMQGQYREQQRPKRPEGEVTIEKDKGKGQNGNSYEGEYVDFEEVD